MRWVIVNYPAGQHRPEPFADVAFVEPSRLGNLLAGRRGEICEHIEQADLMANARHQRDTGAVQNVHHAPGECLGSCLVERLIRHKSLPSRRRESRATRLTILPRVTANMCQACRDEASPGRRGKPVLGSQTRARTLLLAETRA